MRTLIIPQRCIEDIVKASLLEDLANVEDFSDGDAEQEKDILALKRVINFYSVDPPYENV